MPLVVPFCTVSDMEGKVVVTTGIDVCTVSDMEGKAVVTTGVDVWTVNSNSAELDGTTCAVGSVSSVGIVTENCPVMGTAGAAVAVPVLRTRVRVLVRVDVERRVVVVVSSSEELLLVSAREPEGPMAILTSKRGQRHALRQWQTRHHRRL
jgi:hypothetical protein